jgi:iron complex outermembrane receptor protein
MAKPFRKLNGARKQPIKYNTQRYKLGAKFEMSDSWNGYAFYSKQTYDVQRDEKLMHIGRMQEALIGQGGLTGNEYWIPSAPPIREL